MSLVLTIGGIDTTAQLRVNSIRISDTLNQRNTMSFVLVIGLSKWGTAVWGQSVWDGGVPAVGAKVIVTLGGTRVFAGSVDDTEVSSPDESLRALYVTVNCVDFNQIADRHLVVNTYTSQAAGTIASNIVTTVLAGEGLTTGGIQTGPMVSRMVWNYKKASDCFNDLATQTGFAWWIDYNQQFNFAARGTVVAPFALTDSPNSNNFRKLKVKTTRAQYKNRQLVIAGTTTTDPRTESFLGDSQHTAFTLSYPVDSAPTITVNGVAATVGIQGVSTTNCDLYWQRGSTDITQDSARPGAGSWHIPLQAADGILSVAYTGQYPNIVQAQNDIQIAARVAVEGGTGIYEDVESDPNMDTSQLAQDRANGLLRQYAQIPVQVTFETDTDGLASGQLIDITSSTFGLSGSYLIDQVSATDVDGKFLRYQVRALSGETLGNWVTFFAKMAAMGQQFVIANNQVITILKVFSETVALTDTLTATSAAGANSIVGSAVIGFSEIFS